MPVVELPASVARVDTVNDLDEYAALPRDEQLTYVDYLNKLYADDYDRILEDFPDYAAFTPASANNSDRQIVDNLNYAYQLTNIAPLNHTFTSEAGVDWEASADTLQGTKLLSGVINDFAPTSSFIKNQIDVQSARSSSAANGYIPSLFVMVNPNFTGSNFPCIDAVTQAEEVCRSMDVSENGDTGSLRVILTPYVNSVIGETDYMWLAEVRG